MTSVATSTQIKSFSPGSKVQSGLKGCTKGRFLLVYIDGHIFMFFCENLYD
jgi:hypothetical protein